MGAKIPQQSSPSKGRDLRRSHIRKVLSHARTKSGGSRPLLILIRAHIRLSGDDLASNHIHNLLSCPASADNFRSL